MHVTMLRYFCANVWSTLANFQCFWAKSICCWSNFRYTV